MKKLFLIGFFIVCNFFISGYDVNAKEYFNQNLIDPAIIDQPVAVGSTEWKNEIVTIIALQKNPDPKEIKKAASERNLQPEIIAASVDPKLTRSAYPALYKLLDNADDTVKIVCDNTKKYWHTTRPYLADKNIKPLILAHDNASYPSGHTTTSYVDAYILGLLIPEKRQQFLTKAAQIAQHRILVGMHFPHDIAGGKQLSLLIMGGLLSNAEFQQDFALAQKELNKL